MLILTRKTGESIVIGDDVVVTIVESSRDQVRLGVDAPRSITVHRQEVYAQISQENEAARTADSSGVVGAVSGPASPLAFPKRPTR